MSDPLVVIITPAFNGCDMLRGCMDSVRRQTYDNWIHIVVDNASSDGTGQLAADLGADDGRVRVERHVEHLGMLDNWNRAMAHAPDDACYVKQLNVDDRLRPENLRRLVDTAEAHPEVGVVSSYFTYGSRRLPARRQTELTILDGREIVRDVLKSRPDYLGQPSMLLLRRAAAPDWPNIFDPTGFPPRHPLAPPLCQADKEAYFAVMEGSHLAFVPEVLTDVSAGDASATGFSARVAAWHPGRIETIRRHGDRFLDADERFRAMRWVARKYVRSLTWRFCRITPFRDPDFVQFQRLALDYVVPVLREEGITAEAGCLAMFARKLDRRAGVEDGVHA